MSSLTWNRTDSKTFQKFFGFLLCSISFKNLPQVFQVIWLPGFQVGRMWRWSQPGRWASWSCRESEWKSFFIIYVIWSTYHNVDSTGCHSIRSPNADHLWDERAKSDSGLSHRGWENLHCLLEWKINAKEPTPPTTRRNIGICLDVGDNKGGGDVHLEDHAEHLDDRRDASDSVLTREEH